MLMIAFSFAATAADLQPDDRNKKDQNITIINNKKFFSLRDARRFSGNQKPMPLTAKPATLRQPIIMARERIPAIKSPAPEAKSSVLDNKPPAQDTVNLNTGNNGGNSAGGKANGGNSPVLDIFAPEDKK